MHRVTLPNQQRVFCTNPLEVAVIFAQIAPYFQHGINLKTGDTVFDVGANIGLFTLTACDWGQRALQVFAFEPIPALFEALKANVAHYQLHHVLPLSYAVSRQPGEMHLVYYPWVTAMSTAYPYDPTSANLLQSFRDGLPHSPPPLRWLKHLPTWLLKLILKIIFSEQQVVCQAVTLSEIIHTHQIEQIDLLKIDAEKAELDILQGIQPDHWPKIRQVVLEVHDIAGRLDTVTALLRHQGFSEVIAQQEPGMQALGIFEVYARRNA